MKKGGKHRVQKGRNNREGRKRAGEGGRQGGRKEEKKEGKGEGREGERQGRNSWISNERTSSTSNYYRSISTQRVPVGKGGRLRGLKRLRDRQSSVQGVFSLCN